jgi:uncharacterized protein YhdP
MHIKIMKDYLINSKLTKQLLRYLAFIILTMIIIYSSIVVIINVLCFTYNHSVKTKNIILKKIGKVAGINLNISGISFNWREFYHINLTVNDINIIKPDIKIGKVYFAISYSTFAKFQPIFHKISVDGINLKFVVDKENKIYLNGMELPNSDNSDHTELNKFILSQNQVDITNFIISYQDKKRLITIDNQNLNFHLKNIFQEHTLLLKLLNNSDHFVDLKFYWKSPRGVYSFSDPDMFKNNLDISILNKFQYFENKKIKNIDFMLDLIVKDGYVKKIDGEFNIDNKLIDKVLAPSLKGKIIIEQNEHNQFDYKVKSNNLKINDNLLDIKNYLEISGIKNTQQIILKNINLDNLQNELKAIKNYMNITLSGRIPKIEYKWQGSILHPTQYDASIELNNVSIENGKTFFIKHATAVINSEKKHLNIDLNSQNTILRLSNIFQQDLTFKQLSGKINVSFENDVLSLKSPELNIVTPDFKSKLSLLYTKKKDKNPKNFGYLKIIANMPSINANKVDWYLPKVGIPAPVHQYLKMSLVGGHAQDAYLDLEGNLYDFPFNNGKGKFYIHADVIGGKMLYLDKWPTLNNIKGKFILDNNTITVIGDTADCLDKIKISKVKVFIPDYTADNPILKADGEINSAVSDALNYLSNIPIDNIANKLKNYLQIVGNTKASLNLNVPLSKPENTTTEVNAKLLNNIIKFNAKNAAEVNDINGEILFKNNQLLANNISAKIQQNPILINIMPVNKLTRINMKSSHFDYENFINYYYPNLKGIIKGNANSLLNIDINTEELEHISFNSDLVGVAINLPAPLQKAQNEARPLTAEISFNPKIVANINIDKILQSQISFNNDSLEQIYINIGENSTPNLVNQNYKSLITVNTDSIEIAEWKKILFPYFVNNTASELDSLYVSIKTKQLLLNGNSFGEANSNISVNKDSIKATFASTIANLTAQYTNNIWDLNVDKINLNKIIEQFKIINKSKNVENVDSSKSLHISSHLPKINLHINKLQFNDFIATLDTTLNSDQNNIYTTKGVISNSDIHVNFGLISYCIYCNDSINSRNAIYFSSDIKNSGNIIKQITHKNVIRQGSGKLSGSVYWDKLSLNNIVININGELTKGYLLKTQGLIERIFSFFSLQGIKDIGNANLFNSDLAFNKLNFDAELDHSNLHVNKVLISNDFINIFSTVDIYNNFSTINGYLIATPQIGQSVAIISGIVAGAAVVAMPIMIPIVGGAAYLGGTAIGDPLNSVLTNTYCISGPIENSSLKSCSL